MILFSKNNYTYGNYLNVNRVFKQSDETDELDESDDYLFIE